MTGKAVTSSYIAKLTEVQEFKDYFDGFDGGRRKDQIYIPAHQGFETDRKFFRHRGGDVHKDETLQKRDWDTDHDSKELYALVSNQYAYIEKETGRALIRKLEEKHKVLAAGVGHRKFETNDAEIIDALKKLVAGKDHGKKNRPAIPNESGCKGCGTDKA